jgi:two-component system, chemotaxis family, chemotaxis protein CheY
MKALVVDDDIVSRIALMDLLSSYAIFDLVEAEDGEVAWAMFEKGLRPVICFCDVRMPRMSGIDLLQKIKERPELADMPFVLVSSASDRDTVLQAVKLGAIGYILKPLEAEGARGHLEKIFKITLEKLAENPAATLKRLNIGAARLTAYLEAFRAQLDVGAKEITAMLDAGDRANARLRLDTLHTGCVTLGLWYVAGLLDALRLGVFDAAKVGATLAEVVGAVERQTNRIKAVAGAPAAA